MPLAHVIFIPGVLLIGVAIGYTLGVRAAKNEMKEMKERAKE
jgi:uncharacterized protein YneF (UPF0154 family)